jgi:tetratricopeptide (TPR) repeat protein
MAILKCSQPHPPRRRSPESNRLQSVPINSFRDLDKLEDKIYTAEHNFGESKNKDCQQILKDIYRDVKPFLYSPARQSNVKTPNLVARIEGIHAKMQREKYQLRKAVREEDALRQEVQSLMVCEKVLQGIAFEQMTTDLKIVKLRLKNAYLLVRANLQAGDHHRIIRFLSYNTVANLYVKDLVQKLSLESSLNDVDMQNYVLFIFEALGQSFHAAKEYSDAAQTFYQVCKVYNRWKINNQIDTALPDAQDSIEFGVDDYIRAKASYAESLMNMGQIDQAIDKFENVKRSILNEIVYDNPLVFVNVCNQLGNCFLAKKFQKQALENFELSLSMINAL